MIRIYCDKADAFLKETQTLTKGMTNYPEVVLTYSSDWDGMGKAAVVRAGDKSINVLIRNNKFTIPAECFEESGVELIVGVQGSSGVHVIPTVWCACGEILEGTDVNESGNVGEPTEDLVLQMLGYAGQTEALAEEAKESFAEAATGAEAWAVGQRKGEDVGPTDETYRNNAKYYSMVAATNAGYVYFYIDEPTGHLYFTKSTGVDFDFNVGDDGHLYVSAVEDSGNEG